MVNVVISGARKEKAVPLSTATPPVLNVVENNTIKDIAFSVLTATSGGMLLQIVPLPLVNKEQNRFN